MNDDLVANAMTRSGFWRDRYPGSGAISDEALLRAMLGCQVEPETIRALASLARLLRLMDALLAGRATGEQFVGKFAKEFLSTLDKAADGPELSRIVEPLNEFYEEIQLFAEERSHRPSRPGLFGLERLKQLTQAAYDRFQRAWVGWLRGLGCRSQGIGKQRAYRRQGDR